MDFIYPNYDIAFITVIITLPTNYDCMPKIFNSIESDYTDNCAEKTTLFRAIFKFLKT